MKKNVNGGKIVLPIILPITFSGSGKIILPVTLPIRFVKPTENRKSIKLPTTIQCLYANEDKVLKIPISESARTTGITIPLKEKAWVFSGLVLDETVVAMMEKQLILIDDVKSRLLMDTELTWGNRVKVKWYGDEVPKVEVYSKLSFDEKYDLLGTYDWGAGETEITLGGGEYVVMLKGAGDIGESVPTTLGEPEFMEVDMMLEMPLNEKAYGVDIHYLGTFKVEVNY